jgi:hypothetical protein
MRVAGWTIVTALLVLSGTAALGRGREQGRDEGHGRRQCTDIIGYLSDARPGGREVRSAPDPAAPVVGRILEPWSDEVRTLDVSFQIKASQDGWLLIEGAGDDPVLTEGVDRPMYRGEGWIRGEGVSVGVQASQGFAEPRHSSDIIVRTGVNEMDFLAGVMACDGNWVLGRWRENEFREYRYSPRAVVSTDPLVLEAWVTGICNIQETSCDMASGDRPE